MPVGRIGWFWPIAVTLLGYGTALGLVCRHYHVYSWNGWQVYQAMAHECHPVWQEYNFGRIRAGDDVMEVIAHTRPKRVQQKGRCLELDYGDGVAAVACEGKLVLAYAGSCTWVRVFFDEMTEEQSLDYLKRGRRDPQRFGIVPVYR